eukprot:CAMPEP_0197464498 /NCGR_PEP_ID=MMETSP1175-20131217/64054_1 /TAXON_ID=1003142 /ORGANISM="Triceratium dubium, Strain CCMP147" /LENGTH=208 /DNA_ID=CAMNT_0043000479 /DNA_START=823 /DNA_END=1450 /DNA_ORIENTATION=-
MPTIDWNRAGCAGDQCASDVVVGFSGPRYVDHEILGQEVFEQWIEENIDADLRNDDANLWMKDESAPSETTMTNGMGPGPADVIAVYRTPRGDRIEYYVGRGGDLEDDACCLLETSAVYRTPRGDRIEYYVGRGGDLEDDACCLLETSSGHVLIAGCSMCHPYVCCDILDFGNSDGSTRVMQLDGTSGAALVRTLIHSARNYLYKQRH